mmetsp:Transcript_599/g.1926  ORF Transcript_599/g.1926 Transcript_599/m.1926 type:complete len:420 (+) Transcript_599:589-1848(+)
MVGYISKQTLFNIREIRKAGGYFVLVSGGRSSTCTQRLPYLPAADAYVMENGGRLFMQTGENLVNADLTENIEWRNQFLKTAGCSSQDSLPPNERVGELWDVYRSLLSGGWSVDAKSYYTSIRVKVEDSDLESFHEMARKLPASLKYAFNLGMCDIFPANSGKDSAVMFVMESFGLSSKDCVCMCDDDNDLGMAALVGQVYLPGITADSVAMAAQAEPDRFVVSSRQGPMATDDCSAMIYRQMVGTEPPEVPAPSSFVRPWRGTEPPRPASSQLDVPDTHGKKRKKVQMVAHGKHAMIVEDDAVNQKMLTKVVAKMGLNVEVVGNGKEAIDCWEARKVQGGAAFDLIFMDMEMPIMGGMEATRELRKRGADMPIIGFTGNIEEEDKNKCITSGMTRVLIKPTPPKDIEAAVEEVCGWEL